MDSGRILLGEILIARGKITSETLDAALRIQKTKTGFIGEILVGMGVLDEKDIVVALVVQCGLPYIAVDKYTIDRQVLSLIPKEIAQKERLIPFDRTGEILSVVMVNPLTKDRRDYLEGLTRCRIAVFISTKTEIERAIKHNYGDF